MFFDKSSQSAFLCCKAFSKSIHRKQVGVKKMNKLFVGIGYGNVANISKISTIIKPDAAPIKRMIAQAKESASFIDATAGRKTRSLIVMSDGYFIASALQVETIMSRIEGKEIPEKDE